MAEDPYGYLAGHRFPGATITLPAYLCWLWSDAVGAVPDDAIAHPSLAYLVGLRGTGVTIPELFSLLDVNPADGPLLGETEFELRGALRAETPYTCEAEILDVVRKQGRRSGAFDRLRFVVHARAAGESEPAVTCTLTMIFPRP